MSPYRRLELDLQDARETIRVAAGQVVDLHYALTDAVNLLDHPPSAWTHADAMRLERIRKLAEKI
ncbi:MAG: hypothetical protein ACREVZ_06620 [Burkholderiales bacterium]